MPSSREVGTQTSNKYGTVRLDRSAVWQNQGAYCVKKIEEILTWDVLQCTDPFKYCALGYARLPDPQLASHSKLPG